MYIDRHNHDKKHKLQNYYINHLPIIPIINCTFLRQCTIYLNLDKIMYWLRKHQNINYL